MATWGETHGLTIGPHTSNILSEIILVCVDSKLSSKWDYVRNIDDYICFVDSYDNGQLFISELITELKKYNLRLNYRKTKIEELPLPIEDSWITKVLSFSLLSNFNAMKYTDVKRFIDYVLYLLKENNTTQVY